jgi:hypothetical protein
LNNTSYIDGAYNCRPETWAEHECGPIFISRSIYLKYFVVAPKIEEPDNGSNVLYGVML